MWFKFIFFFVKVGAPGVKNPSYATGDIYGFRDWNVSLCICIITVLSVWTTEVGSTRNVIIPVYLHFIYSLTNDCIMISKTIITNNLQEHVIRNYCFWYNFAIVGQIVNNKVRTVLVSKLIIPVLFRFIEWVRHGLDCMTTVNETIWNGTFVEWWWAE